MVLSGLFGNSTAAKVLLSIECFEHGYARELASDFEMSLSPVQKQLARLELEGVLVSRLVGKTRVYEWNPRCFYLAELRALLRKTLDRLPSHVREKYFMKRTRPRRSGKGLP